jgi:hypothetical protein
MAEDILAKQQRELDRQLAAEAARQAAEKQRRSDLAKNSARTAPPSGSRQVPPAAAPTLNRGKLETRSTNSGQPEAHPAPATKSAELNSTQRWLDRGNRGNETSAYPTQAPATEPARQPSAGLTRPPSAVTRANEALNGSTDDHEPQHATQPARRPPELTPQQLQDPRTVDWSKLTPYQRDLLLRVEFRESRAKDEIFGMDRAANDADRDALGRAATDDVDAVRKNEGTLRHGSGIKRDKVKEALSDINRFQYRMEPKLEKEKDETEARSWFSLDRTHPPTQADKKRLMDVFHAEDKLGHKLGRDAVAALDLGYSPVFDKHPAFKEALSARDHVAKEWGNQIYTPKDHVLSKTDGLGQSKFEPKGMGTDGPELRFGNFTK